MSTQVMLILFLIKAQYSQKAVFSFEKGLKGQNHSSSGSHHPIKKLPKQNFLSPTINAIWKTLTCQDILGFFCKIYFLPTYSEAKIFGNIFTLWSK